MKQLSEIIQDLNNSETDYDYVNHHLIRFFRCFLDGSYKGFEHYQSNQAAARELSATEMKAHLMREFLERRPKKKNKKPRYEPRFSLRTNGQIWRQRLWQKRSKQTGGVDL